MTAKRTAAQKRAAAKRVAEKKDNGQEQKELQVVPNQQMTVSQQELFDNYRKELRELNDRYNIMNVAVTVSVQVGDGSTLVRAEVQHVLRASDT